MPNSAPILPKLSLCPLLLLVALLVSQSLASLGPVSPSRRAQPLPGQLPSTASSSKRFLRQNQVGISIEQVLPRLNIGGVQLKQAETYDWTIQRSSSASSIAVTADGYSRQQLGYSLTYTRTLQKREYRLEGMAALTNPSSEATATLTSLTLVIGGQEVQPLCQGMPNIPYVLEPAAVLECPFSFTWASKPVADTVSGYVQTAVGRAAAAASPVPYSFEGCSGPSGGVSSTSCAVVQTAACASVTDGSYIVNKYKDKAGETLAGIVARSRLFDTSSIQVSTLGPPREEPTLPASPGIVSTASVPDTPAPWTPIMPDQSWWNSHRHRLLLDTGASSTPAPAMPSASKPVAFLMYSLTDVKPGGQRHMLTTEESKEEFVARAGSHLKWPYPTITGNRPPVGLGGKPDRGSDRHICDSTTFSYGMVFGPLLPSACGTFEVQNRAAALPTDLSSPAVTHNTYTYLQVLCPASRENQAQGSIGESVANQLHT